MYFSLSLQEVLRLSKLYNTIPITHSFIFDTETPISIYLKLNAFKEKYSFLLESVTGGENKARYSYIGLYPHAIITGSQHQFKKTAQDKTFTLKAKNPIDALEEALSSYKPYNTDKESFFHSGCVGFFAYDTITYIENIHPTDKINNLNSPDMVFVIPEVFICLDHVLNTITITGHLFVDDLEKVSLSYEKIIKQLNEVYKKLQSPLKQPQFLLPYNSDVVFSTENNTNKWTSKTSDEKYKQDVNKTLEYIKAGDIFQTVLSRRFFTKYTKEPFTLYRVLRSINPSPYMFYLNFEPYKLIGSSPEILFKKQQDNILIRPIAGTTKRGKNLKEDEILSKELLSNPKEQAEHVMLLDLARNDIGRVCELSSVQVKDNMFIEKYSHVMHIVSNVVGKLKKNLNSFDCLKAVFPAGTLTGAPKVRAMQIIEELEVEKRGPYGGCVAYYNFNGDIDTAIILRTMFYQNQHVYVHSGAGIVYDSTPNNENEEVLRKSMALFKAVEIALQLDETS